MIEFVFFVNVCVCVFECVVLCLGVYVRVCYYCVCMCFKERIGTCICAYIYIMSLYMYTTLNMHIFVSTNVFQHQIHRQKSLLLPDTLSPDKKQGNEVPKEAKKTRKGYVCIAVSG